MEHEKNYFTGQLKKWLILEDIGTSSLEFYPPVIKHLLHLRGLYENSEAEEFLSISNTLFENPYTLPDIENAIKRLHEAKLQKETVAVFGDFDADGVTGTALLVKALQRFGLNTLSYIPHRVREGHGLNKDAINKLEKEN